jgi:hypothetical protein
LCLAAPGLAEPCSTVFQKHELDAVEQKIDKQPPVQVEARIVSVVRGSAPSGSSCDDIGVIVIELVRVGDDRTPREKLGYRITHVEGTLIDAGMLRSGFVFRVTPVPGKPLQFTLPWIDGATDTQEPIDFTLAVTAVDSAGNESVPSSPIRVSHPGGRPPR